MAFPGDAVSKNLPATAGDTGDVASGPGSGESPGIGNGNPHGKFHGQRNLVDYSPWCHKETQLSTLH